MAETLSHFCIYLSQQQPNLITLTVKNVTSSSPKIQFLVNTFLGANLMVDITGVSVTALTVSVLISTVKKSKTHVFTAVMERQNALRMVRIFFPISTFLSLHVNLCVHTN